MGPRLEFCGGRIDALALCEGDVLRTAEPERVVSGIAQLRRWLVGDPLRILHLVFAPDVSRPLLLSLVRLENPGRTPLRVDYTELWGVRGSSIRPAPGACICETEHGTRALAEAGPALRSRPPNPLPEHGLCLEIQLVLPPVSRRQLCFAYCAPPPQESAAWLVRAWRGDVAGELERTVARWLGRLSPDAAPVPAYRAGVVTLGA